MVHSINTNRSCSPGRGPQDYQDGQLWGPKVETGCPLLAARARLLSPARYHQAGPIVLAPIATQCRRGNTNSEIKPGYHRKAVMHRQPGHEALRVSAVLWSCMVCLRGTWERRGSVGAEFALYRLTPDGAVRSRQKAATPFPFLFIYFYFIIFLLATPFLLRVWTRCFCAGI